MLRSRCQTDSPKPYSTTIIRHRYRMVSFLSHKPPFECATLERTMSSSGIVHITYINQNYCEQYQKRAQCTLFL